MFFCFKQKAAYEMRISDWSSDVCSSDLRTARRAGDRLPGQAAGGDPRHRRDRARQLRISGLDREDRQRLQFEDLDAVRRGDDRPGDSRLAGVHRLRAVEGRGDLLDRKSVVEGKSVSVRVDLVGRRIIQKKKKN